MQPSIPWRSSVSVFVIERTAIIHYLKCTLPFSFVVPLLSVLSLIAICCHSLSHFVTCYTSRCHSLSFVVTRCTTHCHSLYHSLPLVVPLVVTRCTTRCHSLSFVVTHCTTRCHSLSLVVTRCTTRLSFYKRSMVSTRKLRK